MSRKKLILVIVLSILLFSVAIPIAINESYKHGVVYVTKWDAADVLSYYGTILGAAVTIIVLVLTICFTRKQILRESYLNNENDKWSRIESIFATALDSINPMRSLIGTLETGLSDPAAAIRTIQKYLMVCRTATDQLCAHLNVVDYPKVKKLIDEINKASEQFFQIGQEEITAYSKLRDFMSRDTAKKTIDMEAAYPHSFPTETLSFCEQILNKTNGLRLEDMENTIGQLNEKMVKAYQSTYRTLLQLKGSTFEEINTEIQTKADNILRLWGRL